MIRYQYNRQIDPPAPFVHVIIGRYEGSGASVTVPALLDTGADKTVIPQSIIDELGLRQAGVMEVAGLNHLGSTLALYLIQIGIRDLPPVVIDVIGAPGEQYVLLGRDVLNRHHVVLNGPELLCVIE